MDYTTTEVVRATGVSFRKLDYWDRLGYLSPSVKEAEGSGSRRLYSEEDLRLVERTRDLLELGFRLSAICAEGPGALEAKVRKALNSVGNVLV